MINNQQQSPSSLVEPLTRRERDILELLSQELADREIANRLTLAVSSVKWYTRQIYAKLGVENRRQAVSRARELGLLSQILVSGPARNLPRQLTCFIGREKEIAKAVELVWEYPLVTLTGSGGVGKTRLALKIAEELQDDFPNAVWFLELGALNDPLQVPRSLAEALGMSEDTERGLLERLIFYLRDRQALIVFDNCEHLLDACSELIMVLLKALPRLKVLASSREALGINGEAILRVPSLTFPHQGQERNLEDLLQFEAVRLFLERARVVQLEFHFTFENTSAIAQICRRLDGIPLAIELAAARVDSMDVRQIAQRLDQVFRLLTGGSRNALARQQTLRASIDWSYELLTQPERLLFARLAVFSGGWTLETAEAVCGFDGLEAAAVMDILSSLIKKSLVVLALNPGAQPRYRLLETIRQYALEKLLDPGMSGELRRRHRDAFLQLVEQAQSHLRGPAQLVWYDHLEAELDNFRTVLEWALQNPEAGSDEVGLRLACGLTGFWVKNSLAKEGLTWVERYRVLFNEKNLLSPNLCAWTDRSAGALYFALSQYPEAHRSYAASADLYRTLGDPCGLIETLTGLSIACVWDHELDYNDGLAAAEEGLALTRQSGTQWQLAKLLYCKGYVLTYMESPESLSCLEESVALFENAGDRLALNGPIQLLGVNAVFNGDYSHARIYLSRALAACRESRSRGELVFVLSQLGDTAYLEGQYALMETYFQESLAISRETGFLLGVIFSSHHLGIAMRRQGQVERAVQFLRDSLLDARDYNCTNMVFEVIAGTAGIAADTGRLEEATRLLAALETDFFSEMDFILITAEEIKRDQAVLRARLGEIRFLEVWAEGKVMTLQQATANSLRILNAITSDQKLTPNGEN